MKKILILSFCLLVCWGVSAQKRVKVACVGNSITYGAGLSDRATQSYPVQLQNLLGTGYEVENFGKSGATLLNKGHRPYTKQEEYQKAVDFAGDIVVIHLGINDTDPRNWPNYRDFFVSDYLGLIDTFRQANPKARFILARMTPISDRHARFISGTRDWHGEIQTAIETVARYAGAQLIDFHEPLYPYPFLLPDAVHPTAEGAAILAQTVYSAISGNYGGLKLSPLYTDNMVLQRDTPLQIHGTADAGEKVTVSIGRQQWTTHAGTDGKWSVRLLPLKAGGPYTLTISTPRQALEYKNVLVGEVWLCSGQSNMEFMMKQTTTARKDIPLAADEQLRLYDMKARWRTDAVQWDASVLDSLNHLQYYADTQWKTCAPENAADFSAIAYYFGQMLRDSLQVPVGLICNAVGGSPTEAWVDRSTLEYQFPAILKDWLRNDFIQDWVRGRAALNIKQSKYKYQRHPYEPCYLFESGIRPLEQYPIKGVIWYQGESNAHNREAHEKLFKLLVDSWRMNWGNAELPFYYVQLSSINRPSWPWFRDSQRRMMHEIANTGMAVSSDLGDSLDVHPRNKKPIGKRLAHWALNKTYGFQELLPSGPLFRKADFRDGAVFVTFDYGQGMKSSDGKPLRTFEVAEVDGIYYPAKAEVTGDNQLKVYSEQVKNPRYVRYGWQPFTRANLVNTEGFPASTFRAEVPASYLQSIQLQKMSGFPKKEKGINLGVSACFAGITGGQLLIGGGCNFPDTPAAEGGKKKYYKGIYAADYNTDSVFSWRKVGDLPSSCAYGVSVSTSDGVVCIGGMNGDGATTDVYRLYWQDNKQKKITIESLPSLPYALDNFTGALLGNHIYVAGGNRLGKPSNSFLCLNLDKPSDGWQELPSFPGFPRIQPVSAAQYHEGEYCFYLWGGFAPSADGQAPTLSLDGYFYSPSSQKWTKVATPTDRDGEAVSLGGGNALALGDSLILCTGGVNKDIFLSALQKTEEGYMLHPAEWYKFNRRILIYNTRCNAWQEVLDTPEVARAGAALIGNGGTFYNICGELKPGIRTSEIVRITVE